jgi:hypothetical protein
MKICEFGIGENSTSFIQEIGDCSIVENLLSTKLVAVVGNGEHPTTSARKVLLSDKFTLEDNKE